VATSPEHFAPGPRRRFFWRCHAIKELADLQQTTLWRTADLLTRAGTNGGPDEAEVTRAMAIAEHLIEFPRGLPAHHRKWFYECQNLMSSQKTIEKYYAALAGLHQRAQQQAMIRRMEDQPRVQIDVTNSQIGTLNLGTIIGDVQNHLAAVTDSDEVRDGLVQLAQAIVDSDELEDDQRRELLEHVDLLAEEAARPPEKRALRGHPARSSGAGCGHGRRGEPRHAVEHAGPGVGRVLRRLAQAALVDRSDDCVDLLLEGPPFLVGERPPPAVR
jgi:hypothetical protein